MSDSDFDRSLIEEARRISPLDFIGSACSGVPIKVMAGGRRISASKILRAEISSDGIWVSFNWYGECIGDNINLVQNMMPGTKFFDAIEIITGKRPVFGVKNISRTNRRRTVETYVHRDTNLKIPEWVENKKDGREWLIDRGISMQAIKIAEKAGGLKYTKNGIAYIGYNDYETIKYIAVRYFKDQIEPESGEKFNKKDAYGSIKKYPFMIEPLDKTKPYISYIVEGGTNALATLDYALDRNQNVFIMTTGGVAIREWMRNEKIIDILKGSRRIFLVGENESDGEREDAATKQARTDSIRKNVISELNDIIKNQLVTLYVIPDKTCGDMADLRKKMILSNPPERVLAENYEEIFGPDINLDVKQEAIQEKKIQKKRWTPRII